MNEPQEILVNHACLKIRIQKTFEVLTSRQSENNESRCNVEINGPTFENSFEVGPQLDITTDEQFGNVTWETPKKSLIVSEA